MTNISTFTQFLRTYILKPQVMAKVLLYALSYSVIIIALINVKIIINIAQNTPNVASKIWYNILYLSDYLQGLPSIDLVALVIIAILFGFNIELISIKAKRLVKEKNLRFTYGAGILSLVGTGCASCGFSLLSVIGLGGVTAYLPFGGIELSFVTIAILTASLIYNLKTMYTACKAKRIH